ncbi:hypothetical protein FJ651_14570 [Paucihalobacter ruber]|uniref:Uncharacterized protein n=1 Tax=Paucihalobacter ruber TaxID=2567861 RepID=A0A506PD85_9FLAO|nr:hypothetical protein [Paucihalobacter ruber]TPV31415.1 hypothetical protein FJ651_14570 [Paucihalobacter ruber]
MFQIKLNENPLTSTIPSAVEVKKPVIPNPNAVGVKETHRCLSNEGTSSMSIAILGRVKTGSKTYLKPAKAMDNA